MLKALFYQNSRFTKPFLLCFGIAFISLGVAQLYFSSVKTMTAAGLVAISLGALLQQYLEENRDDIWEKKLSPYLANRKLAERFLALFLGVFSATIIFSLCLLASAPQEIPSIAEAFSASVPAVILHNLQIAVAGFLLALLYRSGALVLLLAWNAIVWGESFVLHFSEFASGYGFFQALIALSACLPHIITEGTGYVLAGMAGIFMSKAAVKYTWFSEKFVQVSWASMTLLLLSFAFLALGSLSESFIAQSVYMNILK